MSPRAKLATFAVSAAVVVVAMVTGGASQDDPREHDVAVSTLTEAESPSMPVADVDAVWEWMASGFDMTSWYSSIEEIVVTGDWVEVRTDLYPKEENQEDAVAICAAAMQSPHDGEDFLPVRVLASDARTLARNFSMAGLGPCEWQM